MPGTVLSSLVQLLVNTRTDEVSEQHILLSFRWQVKISGQVPADWALRATLGAHSTLPSTLQASADGLDSMVPRTLQTPHVQILSDTPFQPRLASRSGSKARGTGAGKKVKTHHASRPRLSACAHQSHTSRRDPGRWHAHPRNAEPAKTAETRPPSLSASTQTRSSLLYQVCTEQGNTKGPSNSGLAFI